MKLDTILEAIVTDPQQHARWLNSLSYLEYRGFRKIARSQETNDMSLEILSHAAEEVRHALFFKRLAISVGGPTFNFYNEIVLLAPLSTKSYFFNLDQAVAALLKDQNKGDLSQSLKRSIYCLVTWLIETRAMAVYHVYDQILREKKFSFSLHSILREEAGHLQQMNDLGTANLSAPKNIEMLKILENKYFGELLRGVEKEIRPLKKTNTSCVAGL